MYIHPLTLAPPFYPTSHSTPLGHHRAPSWAPCTMQQLPTSCFTHGSVYVCLITQSRPTLCDPMDCSPAGSSVHGDSPGKSTGVGCYALLQGISPTLGIKHRSPTLQADSLPLSHLGSPRTLEWVAYPFSRGSSNPVIKPGSLALQADSLPAELPGKHLCHPEELNNRFSLAGERKLVT